MNILFITGKSIKSNSSVTMMNISFIRGLVEAGCKVKVITPKLPNNHASYDDGMEIPKTVEVVEVDLRSSYNIISSKKEKDIKTTIVSSLKKSTIKFYKKLSIYEPNKYWVKYANNLNEEDTYYDVIISSSDPKHSHLFAMKLIDSVKIKYGKWVQLWGDPMYTDISNNKLFKKRLYREEKFLISKADKIIYVSPFTAELQKKMYLEFADKIDYVLIPYFSIDNSLPKNIGKKMMFGYYGDYYTNIRNLTPLYEAAAESNINLLIRGNSDKPFKSIANINVKNRVPIKELKLLENNTDVFIHLSNLKGTQIPAKLYYYSGTKKPILFILDGEIEKIKSFYKQFDRYIFCENNKYDILRAIKKIRSSCIDNIQSVEKLSPLNIARELLSKI